MHAARVAALFLAELQSTHRAQRSSARVFRGHALREELLGLALEVILKLFVEFLLDAMAAEEGAQPQWNRVDPMFEAHRILPVRTLCRYRRQGAAPGSRAVTPLLLVAESDHGVDPLGAAHRDPARRQRHKRQRPAMPLRASRHARSPRKGGSSCRLPFRVVCGQAALVNRTWRDGCSRWVSIQ